MEIEYYVGEHDLVAFSEYHASHSPHLKRGLRTAHYIGLLFIALGIYDLVRFRAVCHAGPILVFGILWMALLPTYWRYNQRRQALRMYREGSNRSSLGKQRLHLGDEVLVETSEYQETKTKWGGIEKIESNDDYTFAYTGALMAVVIPKGSVTKGDYDEFVSALRDCHTHRTPDQLPYVESPDAQTAG
jgi:hypothetical protein